MDHSRGGTRLRAQLNPPELPNLLHRENGTNNYRFAGVGERIGDGQDMQGDARVTVRPA